MKYTVIENFTDLQDKNYKYQAGDSFPREGLKVSEKRIDELLTSKNRRKRPMIEAVDEPEIEPVLEPIPESIEEVEVPAPKKGKKKKNAE